MSLVILILFVLLVLVVPDILATPEHLWKCTPVGHVSDKHECNTVRVESALLVTGGHPLVPVLDYKCEPVESAIKE